MNISIKIIPDEEFEYLEEARGADISDSLGFADTYTNRIFVRDSGIDELNQYLINHEISHLFEDEASDEDALVDGIRHIKFRQLLGNIAPFILPIIGGALGGPPGAAIGGAIGGGLKAGIGGEKRTFQGVPQGAAIGGALGFGGSKLTGNFGSIPSRATTTTSAGSFLTPQALAQQNQAGSFLGRLGLSGQNLFGAGNILPNLGKLLGGFNPFGGGGGGGLFGGAGGGGGLPPGAQITGLLGQSTPAGIPGISPSATQSTSQETSPLSFLKDPKNLFGLGSLLTGLFSPFPKVPELPQSIIDLQQRERAGGDPLSQQARGVLSQQLSQEFNPLEQPEIDAALRQLNQAKEDRLDQVRDAYRAIRPGNTELTDSSLRDDLNRVEKEFEQSKADTLAQQTRTLRSDFQNQQARAIQQSLGASDVEFNQLLQLAQLDVDQIAAQLNLDIEQAALFKQTMMEIGGNILFPSQPSSPLVSLNV